MARRDPQRRTSGVGNTKSSDKRPTGREVIGFIEKFLRIPDGPRAGQPLILAPWQKQEIHRILRQSGRHPPRHYFNRAEKRQDDALRGTAAQSPLRPVRAQSSEYEVVQQRAKPRSGRANVRSGPQDGAVES